MPKQEFNKPFVLSNLQIFKIVFTLMSITLSLRFSIIIGHVLLDHILRQETDLVMMGHIYS